MLLRAGLWFVAMVTDAVRADRQSQDQRGIATPIPMVTARLRVEGWPTRDLRPIRRPTVRCAAGADRDVKTGDSAEGPAGIARGVRRPALPDGDAHARQTRSKAGGSRGNSQHSAIRSPTNR